MAMNVADRPGTNLVKMAFGNVRSPGDSFTNKLSDDELVLFSQLISEPAEFVDHPEFHTRGIVKRLYGGETKFASRTSMRFVELPDEIVDAIQMGERLPALTHKQESHLFLRFNYARRQCVQILDDFAGKKLTAANARKLLAWGYRALTARSSIVRLNLPLVLAMAKRTRLSNIDFNDLVSEGNMALLRSVEKFDCSKGFKFSTYSCRAILKSFSRVAMRVSRYRGVFPAEFDPAMEKSDFLDRKRVDVEEDCVGELKKILIDNVAGLSEVECTVIRERFAIGMPTVDGQPAPKTLEQVGHIIGVTKERVRQIQNKALKKIRGALEECYLAA